MDNLTTCPLNMDLAPPEYWTSRFGALDLKVAAHSCSVVNALVSLLIIYIKRIGVEPKHLPRQEQKGTAGCC